MGGLPAVFAAFLLQLFSGFLRLWKNTRFESAQVTQIELALKSGLLILQHVQIQFIAQLFAAFGIRAFGIHIFDPAQKSVRSGFALIKQTERFCFPCESGGGRQKGMLACFFL